MIGVYMEEVDGVKESARRGESAEQGDLLSCEWEWECECERPGVNSPELFNLTAAVK